jgi:hypothetical protein
MLARAILAAGLGTAIGLLAAGCGGRHPPGVASLGTAPTTTTQASGGGGAVGGSPGPGNATAFVAFVDCMQKHGIAAQLGSGGKGVQISGGNPGSPQFAAAQKACQKLLPGGGPQPLTPAEQAQNLKELVKLAACLRAHGFPDFPDPSSQGFFNLSASSGFNPSSPQFQSAMSACRPSGARLRIGFRVAVPAGGGRGGD